MEFFIEEINPLAELKMSLKKPSNPLFSTERDSYKDRYSSIDSCEIKVPKQAGKPRWIHPPGKSTRVGTLTQSPRRRLQEQQKAQNRVLKRERRGVRYSTFNYTDGNLISVASSRELSTREVKWDYDSGRKLDVMITTSKHVIQYKNRMNEEAVNNSRSRMGTSLNGCFEEEVNQGYRTHTSLVIRPNISQENKEKFSIPREDINSWKFGNHRNICQAYLKYQEVNVPKHLLSRHIRKGTKAGQCFRVPNIAESKTQPTMSLNAKKSAKTGNLKESSPMNEFVRLTTAKKFFAGTNNLIEDTFILCEPSNKRYEGEISESHVTEELMDSGVVLSDAVSLTPEKEEHEQLRSDIGSSSQITDSMLPLQNEDIDTFAASSESLNVKVIFPDAPSGKSKSSENVRNGSSKGKTPITAEEDFSSDNVDTTSRDNLNEIGTSRKQCQTEYFPVKNFPLDTESNLKLKEIAMSNQADQYTSRDTHLPNITIQDTFLESTPAFPLNSSKTSGKSKSELPFPKRTEPVVNLKLEKSLHSESPVKQNCACDENCRVMLKGVTKSIKDLNEIVIQQAHDGKDLLSTGKKYINKLQQISNRQEGILKELQHIQNALMPDSVTKISQTYSETLSTVQQPDSSEVTPFLKVLNRSVDERNYSFLDKLRSMIETRKLVVAQTHPHLVNSTTHPEVEIYDNLHKRRSLPFAVPECSIRRLSYRVQEERKTQSFDSVTYNTLE